jgi:hypothetical protein
MSRRLLALSIGLLLMSAAAPSGASAAEECELTPRTACFGLSSASAELSTSQAGAHPEVTLSFEVKQDPASEENSAGFKAPYALTRNVRFELPPGLIGDPNAFGAQQQCSVQELVGEKICPNGSQIGLTTVSVYGLGTFSEPVYMMKPPGGEVAAELGFVAAVYPTLVDSKLRSEGDYGLDAEVLDAIPSGGLLAARTTIWGVPASPTHDHERCTPVEVFGGCTESEARPPGGLELPFWTNPTTCGAPLSIRVAASSWSEPDRFDTAESTMGQIAGCNRLPFGPSLEMEPTSHRAASPSGASVTIKLPASQGVEVLEPSQMRDISVKLPEGFAFNPSAGDGLATCSPSQVHFKERVASDCPDAAKLADTEFDIPVLERNLKGAVYLREPEPGHPFRIWITADDLGLHVKLPGELEVDKQSGQITSVTTEIPQAPVREAKLEFKSGFRAPLVTPQKCGEYRTSYEFTPWSGGPPVKGTTPMQVNEGCDTGGFNPKLSAGTTDPSGGEHSPFVFTLTRQDGEQNPQGLDITLPPGLAATFKGIARCEGAGAISGNCPAASRLGHVDAAVGAGTSPLWVPQQGKRPTAVYLGGPYKGAPTSIVAVVPKQAGPFDFGDEVVRSAIYVDPRTAQATAKADPLPQLIEGIPIGYRTLHVDLDRPNFTLNPTGCGAKAVTATVTSAQGTVAHPSSPFAATNCASLGFKPRLSLKLNGGTKRGAHPALTATFRPRTGDANASEIVARLPHSAFLDQAHIRTICTRVQFTAGAGNGAQCPAGAVYGHVTAYTPILEAPLEGPVFLRSSNHNLPDLVFALHGPPSLPIDIEAVARIDSVKGGIRASFEAIPDAPLTKVVLEMQGAKKGLIVNSTDLCAGSHRADVELSGHNGKAYDANPALTAKCGKAKRQRHKR